MDYPLLPSQVIVVDGRCFLVREIVEHDEYIVVVAECLEKHRDEHTKWWKFPFTNYSALKHFAENASIRAIH